MAMKKKVKQSAASFVPSIKEALEEWVIEKEAQGKSASTIRNYKQSVTYFMQFIGATDDTTCDTIDRGQFIYWMRTLQLSNISPSSTNHYLRDCRAFAYWCMEDVRGYIPTPFKIELVKAQDEGIKNFDDEEMISLLAKPKKTDSFATWRTWAIVNWVLGTGNRSASICEIQLRDINYKAKEITLRLTKNKEVQIIPLSSSLESVLKEYIRIWRNGAANESYLFPNIGDEKLTTNALRHSFSKYCKDRGVEKTNIHGLRHSFAKSWVKNNGNIYALQKILGHKTLEMTRRYVNLFSEDIKEGFDSFAALDVIKKTSKRSQRIQKA